jgi:hypothetical protein
VIRGARTAQCIRKAHYDVDMIGTIDNNFDLCLICPSLIQMITYNLSMHDKGMFTNSSCACLTQQGTMSCVSRTRSL